MTEVCLLLMKGNMGGTRPTAPKARRSRQQSGLGYEVGEGEGIKSLSCFHLSLPLDPIAASLIGRQWIPQYYHETEGLHLAPQLWDGRCSLVPRL